MIGLKRGTVRLCEHEAEWETEARKTIVQLKKIMGPVIQDIQHVGSTSIRSIKAKPILDIAVAVEHFEDVLALEKELEENGFYYRPGNDTDRQLLFACGNFYDGSGDMQTHFIHVVRAGSMEWINYVNFRDYLNSTPSAAKAYEDLKVSLAGQVPVDGGREMYTRKKHDFIALTLRKALAKSYLGKVVSIQIDRPLGSRHPEHRDIIYPVNYGSVPGAPGGDGEDLDVYLLGVEEPVRAYTGRIIGILHRKDDVEDKLVMAPAGVVFTREEVARQVYFQEQYFQTEVEML